METILRTASQEGGTTKTRLMYSAYLSYDQTCETLAHAEEWGLLTRVSASDQGETKSLYVYKATPRALEWLRTYAHLVALQGGKAYRD
jgi:predicted transcriptional regulator